MNSPVRIDLAFRSVSSVTDLRIVLTARTKQTVAIPTAILGATMANACPIQHTVTELSTAAIGQTRTVGIRNHVSLIEVVRCDVLFTLHYMFNDHLYFTVYMHYVSLVIIDQCCAHKIKSLYSHPRFIGWRNCTSWKWVYSWWWRQRRRRPCLCTGYVPLWEQSVYSGVLEMQRRRWLSVRY